MESPFRQRERMKSLQNKTSQAQAGDFNLKSRYEGPIESFLSLIEIEEIGSGTV